MMAETTSKEMLDATQTQEDDPADFLFTNTQYHDCHLTVGDPEVDDVERIGVSSSQLIAHSSVFRGMLVNSKLADPSGVNTHVKDVSPATFKLMLRHVYGGKLPMMTPEEAAQLALCAEKYNIQRLVEKAAKHITPTSATDVFTALMCVPYINCPSLEQQVIKIIQQQTDQICQNPQFLDLDENCILFIVKQSILNIREVELWQNIVRWAESQAQKCPARTPRSFLDKVLQYVRLSTLSCEEVIKHVLPTGILTPEEYVDLTSAVSLKQTIKSLSICSLQEKRLVHSDVKCENVFVAFPQGFNFKLPPKGLILEECKIANYSTLIIKPRKDMVISSFVFKGKECTTNNSKIFSSYEFSCSTRVYKSEGCLLRGAVETLKVKEHAVPLQDIELPLKRNNGQPLVLEAGDTYSFVFELYPALRTHKMGWESGIDQTREYKCNNDFTYTFVDPFHVLAIRYRV